MLARLEADGLGNARQSAACVARKSRVERRLCDVFFVAVQTILPATLQSSPPILQNGVSVLGDGISDRKAIAESLLLLLDAALSPAVKKRLEN